eukprot:3609810-Alexandrium_andersonii.AAC.1
MRAAMHEVCAIVDECVEEDGAVRHSVSSIKTALPVIDSCFDSLCALDSIMEDRAWGEGGTRARAQIVTWEES